MGVKRPYTEAVSTGQYVKKSGLSGKYDNVRRFWEDEVTRQFIRPYLKNLVLRKARGLERLRILDIGCGAGDGYELLMGITTKDVGIYEYEVKLIDQEMLGYFLGIDINRDLLKQAEYLYGNNNKITFQESDFNNGIYKEEPPFDVYLTSYGTLSHNRDEQNIKLLSNIALHSEAHALIICDWLGRYSYEWQTLWETEEKTDTFMDYRISYIYNKAQRKSASIESFPLRYVSRQEVINIITAASEQSGVKIEIKKLFDRSIFVGRHMDTAEYNKHSHPVRKYINSLLEPNIRTDLNPLIIDYVSKRGFQNQNNFLEGFAMCWNRLVKHTIDFLAEFQQNGSLSCEEDIPLTYTFYPEQLKNAVERMRKVISATGNLLGDSRANIIEPQLAYALRNLEMDMQPGMGIGHGLVAILEVDK